MEATQETTANPVSPPVENAEGTQYDHSAKPRVVVTAAQAVVEGESTPAPAGVLPEPGTIEHTDPNALPTEAEKWAWDENTDGVGQKPEWLDPKYKTVAEQAKAYKEAQSQLSKRAGEVAPEEYEVSIDESVKEAGFDVALESPVFKEFEVYARKNNFSQEHFNDLTNFYVKALQEMHRPLTDEERTVYVEEQMNKLGNGGAETIDRITQWGRANCTEEQFEWFKSRFDSAEDILNLKAIFLDRMTPTAAGVTGSPTPKYTRDDLKEMKKDPKYEYDVVYQKAIDLEYQKLAEAGTLGQRAGGFSR